MTEAVVLSHFDHGRLGPQALEQRREVLVRAAVVSHLQHVHVGQREPGGDLAFRIRGEEHRRARGRKPSSPSRAGSGRSPDRCRAPPPPALSAAAPRRPAAADPHARPAPALPGPPRATRCGGASLPSCGRPPSSSSRTGSDRTTSSSPPWWSSWACVSTTTSSARTPWSRSLGTRPAPGGPPSTSTVAPSGVCSSVASPWPTSRNVTVNCRGAVGWEPPNAERDTPGKRHRQSRREQHPAAAASWPAGWTPTAQRHRRRRPARACAPSRCARRASRPAAPRPSERPRRRGARQNALSAFSSSAGSTATCPTPALSIPSHITGATAGSAARFAGSAARDARSKWNAISGPVAIVAATVSAVPLRNGSGSGPRARPSGARQGEDAHHGGEAQLPADVLPRPRVERERHHAGQQQAVPARGGPPRERGQRPGDAHRPGAHDRRPGARERHVQGDQRDHVHSRGVRGMPSARRVAAMRAPPATSRFVR